MFKDFRAAERTYKPNSVPTLKSNTGGDHSSWRRITAPLMRPTRKRPALRAHLKFHRLNLKFEIHAQREVSRINPNSASLFGLAPQGVCLADDVATAAGDAFTSPFHHRPARLEDTLRAVYSLLHYSVGSPRLAVSQPAYPMVFGLSSGHVSACIQDFKFRL
jgi:hypothetical protein